jgi:sortase (surface protein transpeptidase)
MGQQPKLHFRLLGLLKEGDNSLVNQIQLIISYQVASERRKHSSRKIICKSAMRMGLLSKDHRKPE